MGEMEDLSNFITSDIVTERESQFALLRHQA
jgi:hypothetical protein